LLGVTLNGRGLGDFQALARICEFRGNFESALEEKLAGAEEEQKRKEIDAIVARETEILNAVMEVAGSAVYDAVKNLMKGKALRTTAYRVVEPYAWPRPPLEGRLIEVGVVASIYTGHRTPKGNIRSDHNLLSREVLGKLKTVRLNGFGSDSELHLRRIGKPESVIYTLGIPDWEVIISTHRVQATYAFQISKPVAVEIYKQHMQNK